MRLLNTIEPIAYTYDDEALAEIAAEPILTEVLLHTVQKILSSWYA